MQTRATSERTLIRKAVVRMHDEGVWKTFVYARHWLSEKYHESALGIETSGEEGAERSAGDTPDSSYEAHQPVEYRSVIRALNRLRIRPDRDVFLDHGSGMGRAVVVAATYPFRRVIGVELSKKLNEVALRNVEKARSRLKCRDVQLINADASKYQIPDDVTVIHLYNPFEFDPQNLQSNALPDVQRNIAASLERAPRKITVIFRYPDFVTNAFAESIDYRQVGEIDCFTTTGERMLIYETG